MASMDLQLDESSCKEFEDYFPLKLAFVQLKDNQWTEVESVLEENKDDVTCLGSTYLYKL